MPQHIDRLVRKLESIGDLGAEDRRVIEQLPLRLRELPAGADAASQGQRPSASCLLLDGFMHRYKVVGNGGRQILALHTPGDIPDLMSVFLPVMDHSLAATVDCKVAFVEHRDIHDAIRQSRRLGELMWRDTLIDGAIFREWLTSMGRQPAANHLAHLICELFLRLQAVGLAVGNSCTLPLTQQVIADALGLSQVHTDRSLQILKARGFIEFEQNRLTVLDWDRMAAFAEFDPIYLHFKNAAYGRPCGRAE
jgi:CRP-like cAMP-binding protein